MSIKKTRVPPHTVNFLAEKTGQDRRTVKKKLVDAGLYPPEQHAASQVLEAIRPSDDIEGRDIKARKMFEEWRKLKIANDVKESKLQDASREAEWLGALMTNALLKLDQRLTNELPAMIEGLDAPQIRVRTKRIYDQFKEDVAPMARRLA